MNINTKYMKRTLLYITIGATFATVTACSSDDVVSAVDNEIKFTAVTKTVSRSHTIYPNYYDYQVDKVAVWSSLTNEITKHYFKDACANYTLSDSPAFISGLRFTETKHYWPEETCPLDFFIISTGTRDTWIDTSSAEFEKNASGTSNNLSLNYTLPEHADDQDDLLFAVSKNITQSSSNGKVPLYFRHALSCFRFKFNVENEHFALYVKSVSIRNISNTGTLIFGDDDTYADTSSSSPGCTWNISDNVERKDDVHIGVATAYAPCYRKSTGTADFELTVDEDEKYEKDLEINESSFMVPVCDGYLFAIPQKNNAWVPDEEDKYDSENDIYSFNGPFIEIECRIYHISDPSGENFLGPEQETLIYGSKNGDFRKILVPINATSTDNTVTWQPGTLYTYTFTFGGTGTNSGYDPDDPTQPALNFAQITFDVNENMLWGGNEEYEFIPDDVGGNMDIDVIE